MYLQLSASYKVPKDTIWFFAKLSVMCRHNTASSLELAAFFIA